MSMSVAIQWLTYTAREYRPFNLPRLLILALGPE